MLFYSEKKFSTAGYYIERNKVCEEIEQHNIRINAQILVFKSIQEILYDIHNYL